MRIRKIGYMNYSKNKTLNTKVTEIIKLVKNLENFERFRGAYIFGSAAHGEFEEGSDLDVKVLTDSEEIEPKDKHLTHPVISGIKLDLSFNSFQRLERETNDEIESAKRVPIIADSIILFDKDGKLTKLKKRAEKIKPAKYPKRKYNFAQFVILNEDIKVRRNLKNNPEIANYVMHTGLEDMIKIHYQVHGKWQLSNKKTLQDLKKWDKKLFDLIINFIGTSNVKKKFKFWSEIINHILQKVGGRIEISETGCECNDCKSDLTILLKIL